MFHKYNRYNIYYCQLYIWGKNLILQIFLIYSNSLPYDMERLKVLEEEQEMLNSSLIALTTHFAQVLNKYEIITCICYKIQCFNV